MTPIPRLAVAAIVAAFVLTAAAESRAAEVDLELVLAVDISGSIDEDEARLQRDGYVAALTDEHVLAAIAAGALGRIAVTYLEWADFTVAYTTVDWDVIDSLEAADRFARRLAAAPLVTAMWTSISGATDFAISKLAENPHHGRRRVIDISGDGANNSGEYVTYARDRAVRRGITINGLPIINGRTSRYGMPPIRHLDLYYEDCVIGGPGAFLIIANGFADFARAIRHKLILEIAGVPAPAKPDLMAAALPVRPGCDAGENRMLEYYDDY
jgi:hypothetical protein